MIDSNQVVEIIKGVNTSCPPAKLDPNGDFKSMHLDSLDIANILLALEERFDIKIDDFEMAQLHSIPDIARLLNVKVGGN